MREYDYLIVGAGLYGAVFAYEAAKKDAAAMLAEPVPLQIRNGVTDLMRELHYGEGYQYAHDREEKLTAMECLPESLRGRRYYTPAGHGSEARVVERMRQIEALRAEIRAREAGTGAQEAENREKQNP